MTGRSLTTPQRDVLSKGLNLAPAPTRILVVDTITAVEAGARQLQEEDAEDLRGHVCGILRHAKPPKDDMTKVHLHENVFACICMVHLPFTKTLKTILKMVFYGNNIFEDGFQSGSFSKRRYIAAV